MANIIIGIIIMIVGFLMVWKTIWFYNFFGRIGWAEKYISTEGGSYLAYKLIGILAIFIGFFLATGWINDILIAIFAPKHKGGY